MNWVKPQLDLQLSGTRVLDLKAGDMFSINNKATRFIIVSATENDLVVRTEGKSSPQHMLPLSEYGDLPVIKHEAVSGKTESDLERRFEVFDRVALKDQSKFGGIILDINDTKVPDLDIIVHWDKPLHGEQKTEVHPHEVVFAGKANKEQRIEAEKHRQFLKATMERNKKDHLQDLREKISQDASRTAKERETVLAAIKATRQVQVNQVISETIGAFATDMKAVYDAAGLYIMSGMANYEIGRLPEIIDSYRETVYARVQQVTKEEDLKVAAAEGILQKTANAVLDSYFLIRQAYIGKRGNKYVVYSKSGKTLGTHDTKKAAIQQLRAVEVHKHMKE